MIRWQAKGKQNELYLSFAGYRGTELTGTIFATAYPVSQIVMAINTHVSTHGLLRVHKCSFLLGQRRLDANSHSWPSYLERQPTNLLTTDLRLALSVKHR